MRIKSCRKGVSLVEGIVAALIFMIAFVGMAHIYVLCKKKLVVSNTKLMAINYARETLDRLRSMGDYSTLTSSIDSLPSGDLKDNYSGTREYTVELGPDDYAASSGERYKIIKVKVEWAE